MKSPCICNVSITSWQFLLIRFPSYIIFFLSSPLLVSRLEIFTPVTWYLFERIPPRFYTAISTLLLAGSLIAPLSILPFLVFLTLNNSFTLSCIMFLALWNVLPIVRSRFLPPVPFTPSLCIAYYIILSAISFLYVMFFLPLKFCSTFAVCTTALLP